MEIERIDPVSGNCILLFVSVVPVYFQRVGYWNSRPRSGLMECVCEMFRFQNVGDGI